METEQYKIEEMLQKTGLNQLETACYLALLKKSPLRASNLAKLLGVPKATILDALRHLSDGMNIVKRSKQKNYYLFLVEDPFDLIAWVQKKKEEYGKHEKTLSKLLPELRSLQQYDVTKPKVYYFEGKDGMKQALEQVLDEADEIIGYGSNEDDVKYLPNLYPSYYERRVTKKIPVRAIIPATRFNVSEALQNEQKHLRKTHLVPETWNYPIQVNVYRNTVVFYSFEESFSLMIKSKPIAECLKRILELAFEKTGEYDQAIRSGSKKVVS